MSDRAEHVLASTPLGVVVHTENDGREWIFIGWSANTAGFEMNFIRTIKLTDYGAPPHAYHASMADTLIKKFPALAGYRKQDDQG